MTDPEAARLLGDVPASARGECWWLVRSDGSLIAGDAGGGAALLAEMAMTRPVAVALRTVHAGRYVDALDKLIARHRGRLGDLVPDGEAPRRYP